MIFFFGRTFRWTRFEKVLRHPILASCLRSYSTSLRQGLAFRPFPARFGQTISDMAWMVWMAWIFFWHFNIFQAPKSHDFLPTFWAHHLCLVVRWADGSKLEARSGTEKRNGRAQREMAIAMGEVLGFKKNGLFH